MNIMTLNFRNGNFDDGMNCWNCRRGAFLQFLVEQHPDILCAQECVRVQADAILASELNYGMLACERDDSEDSEMMAVFFDRSKLLPISYNTIWLSEIPDLPGSKLLEAGCVRNAVIAKFKHRATGNLFYIVCTHLDHISDIARKKGANILLNSLPQDLPLIICGDFNEAPEEKVWQLLSKNYATAINPATINEGCSSYHNFGQLVPTREQLIDWIFYSSSAFSVNSFNILANNSTSNIYISDHYPVSATLDFSAKKQ